MHKERGSIPKSAVTEKPPGDGSVAGVARLLAAAGAARVEDGLGAEELLLFLAVGHLSIDRSCEMPRLMPRTYLEIAEYLHIPRETVRRKLGRLCDRGFGRIVPGGIVVSDLAAFTRLVDALFPSSSEGRTEDSQASA